MLTEFPKPNQETVENPTPTKLSAIGSFAELRKEGFTPYSVGALYVHIGIPDSLAVRFVAELKEKRNLKPIGSELTFTNPVLNGCAEWDFLLDAMDDRSFGIFRGWLGSLKFYRKETNEYFSVRHYQAPVIDPIDNQTETFLDVFCPEGMSGSVKPELLQLGRGAAPRVINLISSRGPTLTTEEGKAVLDTL